MFAQPAPVIRVGYYILLYILCIYEKNIYRIINYIYYYYNVYVNNFLFAISIRPSPIKMIYFATCVYKYNMLGYCLYIEIALCIKRYLLT